MRSFLILLLLPCLLMAEIIEISQLKDLLPSIKKQNSEKLIVVFDIDNTLLIPVQQLGSVAWADHIAKNLEAKGISSLDAQEIVSVLWRTVHPYVRVKTVDPDTISVIKEIQSRNIPVICLTGRKPVESEYTQRQLQSVDIDLTTPPLLAGNKQSFIISSDTKFDNGIIFATPVQKKSKVLLAFLDATQLHPKQLIFVDDKMSHVKDVENTLIEKGIDCLGVRFSAADASVKQFNPLVAEVQWQAFPEMMSDELAYKILKTYNLLKVNNCKESIEVD